MSSNAFTEFKPALLAALEQLGMTSDVGRADLLLAYLQQLQHWNKAYNLTAIRKPEDMLIQHVFDSLAVVPVLRQHRHGRDTLVADMGSGAGLPGIILGICQPDWRIVCVDAVGKKTAFIRQAAGALGLPNVRALHGRIETMESLQADIVVSRAFASLVDFVEISAHHRADDGVLWAMKGQHPEDEIRQLQATGRWAVVSNTTLQVPQLSAQRCLLELGPKESHDYR
ncbi:16S rRNA (guanine(527)-N(7))-methyltransferase RsmG [Castellaniella sp.]|uniref:16S rRNA (guanine(527)-N(7))-methyltransferase RsmG n=1 Tax=Castellaniella sp. TaxID=1955812 RepID=UPI002AFF35BE|nr:16S rRNA (guanine(527)-N(7))-methyltransferase RsmG [Castellaniella sp.]